MSPKTEEAEEYCWGASNSSETSPKERDVSDDDLCRPPAVRDLEYEGSLDAQLLKDRYPSVVSTKLCQGFMIEVPACLRLRKPFDQDGRWGPRKHKLQLEN